MDGEEDVKQICEKIFSLFFCQCDHVATRIDGRQIAPIRASVFVLHNPFGLSLKVIQVWGRNPQEGTADKRR